MWHLPQALRSSSSEMTEIVHHFINASDNDTNIEDSFGYSVGDLGFAALSMISMDSIVLENGCSLTSRYDSENAADIQSQKNQIILDNLPKRSRF
jgi:hypothetical protein